jgi:hypothetical protein
VGIGTLLLFVGYTGASFVGENLAFLDNEGFIKMMMTGKTSSLQMPIAIGM